MNTKVTINSEKRLDLIKFSELKRGDYFIKSGVLYRKFTEQIIAEYMMINAIRVDDGMLYGFHDYQSVTLVTEVEINYN